MAVSSRATSSGSNARMSTRAGPLAILPAAQPAPARTTAAPTHLVVRMDGKLPATGTRPPACRLPTPRATMGAVLLEEIAETSAAVAASSARLPAPARPGRGPPGGGVPLRRAAAAPDRRRLGGAPRGTPAGRRAVADRRRGRRRLRADRA